MNHLPANKAWYFMGIICKQLQLDIGRNHLPAKIGLIFHGNHLPAKIRLIFHGYHLPAIKWIFPG